VGNFVRVDQHGSKGSFSLWFEFFFLCVGHGVGLRSVGVVSLELSEAVRDWPGSLVPR